MPITKIAAPLVSRLVMQKRMLNEFVRALAFVDVFVERDTSEVLMPIVSSKVIAKPEAEAEVGRKGRKVADGTKYIRILNAFYRKIVNRLVRIIGPYHHRVRVRARSAVAFVKWDFYVIISANASNKVNVIKRRDIRSVDL